MKSCPRARWVRRASVVPVLTALLAGLWSSNALAQCTLNGSPRAFEPALGADKPGRFLPGYTNAIEMYKAPGSTRKLVVMENYGYAVLDASNPGSPNVLAYHDMVATVPQAGDGHDGPST